MPRTPDIALLDMLRNLLDQALELEPEEREVWLTRLRQEDPRHARELEALLVAEPSLDQGGFLDAGRMEPGPDSGLAGRRVGPYTLERPLGRGGMGTVWLARRSDGRYEGTVAIKLLNLALIDPVGSERFRREGTVLARLSHPNIARLLDAGVFDAGQPYLVLEHVEGTRVDTYCDERSLGPEERLHLFLAILGAVAHAHANLIVHRDLKPSNILVTADGTVKLLDFGIAKLLEDEAGVPATTLTDAGARALTPEYAAPEQVTGGTVTTATDVYALGVLLYLLLAGRHPTGEGSRTAAEHFRGIVDTEPMRLSAAVTGRTASVERLRRLYAGDLDNIVAKALRKRPEERYAGVAAFADDLRRYLTHEPVSARPDSLAYRAGKFLRRHRGSVVVAALVAFALIGAVVVTWSQMLVARRQRDEAVFQARRAESIRDFQTALISQIGSSPVSLRQLLDKGVALLERRPPTDPRLYAALLQQFADRYGELEQRTMERNLLARADSAAARSADRELSAGIACAIAHHHTDTKELDSAEVAMARAGALLSSLERSDPTVRATCLLPASGIEAARDRLDSAALLARSGLAILDSAGAGATLPYYMLQTELADHLRGLGRVREAIALDESSREGLLALGLDGSLLASSVNNNLAQVLFERGERREGLEILRDVLEQTRLADPEGGVHPVVGFNYATQLTWAGELDSALYWYRSVAASASARDLAEVERRATMGVARISARLRRVPEAKSALARLLGIARAQGRPAARESLFVAATIELAQGDTARGTRTLESVLRHDGFFDGKQTPVSRAPLLELTRAALARAPDRALEHARVLRRLALTDSLAAIRSADVGEADLLAARAHARLGAADSARHYAKSAITALTVGAGVEHPMTTQARALLDSVE
jgi:serine/threonine-protein kinase